MSWTWDSLSAAASKAASSALETATAVASHAGGVALETASAAADRASVVGGAALERASAAAAVAAPVALYAAVRAGNLASEAAGQLVEVASSGERRQELVGRLRSLLVSEESSQPAEPEHDRVAGVHPELLAFLDALPAFPTEAPGEQLALSAWQVLHLEAIRGRSARLEELRRSLLEHRVLTEAQFHQARCPSACPGRTLLTPRNSSTSLCVAAWLLSRAIRWSLRRTSSHLPVWSLPPCRSRQWKLRQTAWLCSGLLSRKRVTRQRLRWRRATQRSRPSWQRHWRRRAREVGVMLRRAHPDWILQRCSPESQTTR